MTRENACFVDTALRADIDALLKRCSEADGLKHEIYTDASINAYREMPCAFSAREGGTLVGFLFIFAPGRDEIEISALVDPAWRGRGLFRSMLRAAEEECARFSYRRGFLVCNEASAGAMQIMARWKLPLDHAEYQMALPVTGPACALDPRVRLEKLQPAEILEIAPLMAECFEKDVEREKDYLTKGLSSSDRVHWILKQGNDAIGFCGVYREGDAFNLFGLGIIPQERGKGYARKMLDLVYNLALDSGASEQKLDVDSENADALRLYVRYGFTKTGATEYYGIRF